MTLTVNDSQYTILIIDDNLANLQVLSELPAPKGGVVHAYNYVEALQTIKHLLR